MKPVREAMLSLDGDLDIEIWPSVENKERVNFAVAWDHPQNLFKEFPNLQVISSLGAGVDHLINDQSVPANVKITRVVIPSLNRQMFDYIETDALNIIRHTFFYHRNQKTATWEKRKNKERDDLTIGVMGLGEIGMFVAEMLAEHGWNVCGWSKSEKKINFAKSYGENDLDTFLSRTNILVCLLPLTSETEDILDLGLFKKLKSPSHLVNVARGEHLVEEDLLYALDMDILKSATLDVFRKEPLPESHPLWSRDKVLITPHIASLTVAEDAAEIIVENYKRMLSGIELLFEADREKQY
ncbi:MAG TPA: glyoxylate/hydroxypyruvate reductase A [Balneolaceae bacterium]|nr:glyoxylate/hydroxypyruvate reductase A [Balneolaceae bacterium]